MRLKDWPPTENVPEPSVDPEIRRELLRIGGVTPSNMPVLRMVWGQSMDSSYYCPNPDHPRDGHRHLSYRHHVYKEVVYFEYGLDGQVRHIYEASDLLPGSGIVEPKVRETDIGIPRFVIEYARPLDARSWQEEEETKRFGDHGPVPRGAVDYEALCYIAEHDQTNGTMNGETMPLCCLKARFLEGKHCYGRYRAPSRRDLEWIRAKWKNMTRLRKNTYGFFDKPSELDVRIDWAAAAKIDNVAAEKETEANAGEMYQALSHLRGTFTREGPRSDRETYTVMGVPTTVGDNQFKRTKEKSKA